MKKVLFGLLILGAIFCCSSCAKSCHCTVTVDNDATFFDEWDVSLDPGERCSDFESNTGGKKTSCTGTFGV